MATSTKPAARLDSSLLLARKGEAQPAIHATSQNNPGLAWGGELHPEDFQAQIQTQHAVQPQPKPQQQPAQLHVQPVAKPVAQSVTKPVAKPVAKPTSRANARLRPDSFLGAHTKKRPGTSLGVEQVAMTLRVDDETYLRLKYLAQNSGHSTQHVLNEAINAHLGREGLPRTRKLMVKPTDA
ncbi:hypothetical protein ACFL12_06940 [Pseudomonadota bacterium]